MNSKLENNYYEPPPEWRLKAIMSRYANHNKVTDYNNLISFSHIETYQEQAQTKAALQLISDAIKADDPAAISISIEFVISPVFFHYSGYIRATMARRLKSKKFNPEQVQTIITGIEALMTLHKTSHEFKEIKKLYSRIKNGQ